MSGTGRSGWLHDVSAGDWIAPRLHTFSQDTGSIIPEGFDAYARIFHPVGQDGRWADLALRNGRIAHSEMQLHLISAPPGEQGEVHDSRVSWGSLPIEERRALVEVLIAHTTSPERCWLAVWEGFGDLDDGGVVERIAVPGRRYLLASGRVEAAMEPLVGHQRYDWGHSPNLWWPDDRAWFVATEIDFAWTYVGGTRAAINAVLADDRLEALESRLSDDPKYDGDLLNAALDD